MKNNKPDQPDNRYDFISQLRGWGAIFVVVSHLVFMYYNGAASNAFSFMLPVKNTNGISIINYVTTALSKINFSFGAFGICLFFLISGFLISNSHKEKNAVTFIIKRMLRLYPVYILGFSITFLCIYLYIHFFTKGTFIYTFTDWLKQVSLFRDFLWVPSIDEISWTLEAQVKFYIFSIILLHLNSFDNFKGIIWIGMGLSLVSYLSAKCTLVVGISTQLFAFFYCISFGTVLILYMLIGLCFFNLYKKIWDIKQFLVTSLILYFLFIIVIKHSVVAESSSIYIYNYSYGLLLFSLFFFFRDRLIHLKVIDFISRISFSIYILHGLNGYMLMSILDNMGVPPVICLVTSIIAVIFLSFAFYSLVEKPLGILCKKITASKTSTNCSDKHDYSKS